MMIKYLSAQPCMMTACMSGLHDACMMGTASTLIGDMATTLGDRFSGWLSIYTASKGELDAKALVKLNFFLI